MINKVSPFNSQVIQQNSHHTSEITEVKKHLLHNENKVLWQCN